MNANFYDELKSSNDIVSVANALGFNGRGSHSYIQGDCPRHGSSGRRCLTIWPGIQGWKCFHCGAKGDVIDLVMHYKNCDHTTAVRFLADRAGIPYWGGKDLTPEEITQAEKDMKERILVEKVLTETAEWYHAQLNLYPEIVEHLQDKNYGFSQEIIEQQKIGFAPVSKKKDRTSELADHLNSLHDFKGNLHLTGLFTFKHPSGPYYDYFRNRIVFPYWKGGKAVYMLARATRMTPQDEFECYNMNPSNQKNDNEKPEYIKYKKLRVHDPSHEKKKYISRFIRNDVFLGEDTVRGADEIIIAEGVPDWISAIDKGFRAISPVTVAFREEDNEKLERLTQSAKSVYIINDNEDNKAGYKGALKTGKYLTERGRNVFLVELPRPAGSTKIDLNEYLKDHTADELKGIMNGAKSVIQILIEQLPGDYLKAQPAIKEDIAPLLVNMDEGIVTHYANLLAKKTKAKTKPIMLEIEAARKLTQETTNAVKKEIEIDPEIDNGAVALTLDPMVFKMRIDAVNEAGVVGERRIIAMYLCAIDSRLLPDNFLNPNVLAVKNAGHFGAGKSYTLTMCTQVYPDNAFFVITNGSAKSLYYLQGGLKNKCLIVTEGFQFQENNAADSELVYSIRSLISEGRVSYCMVEKDESGKLVTVEKKLEGPTSFITTTIMENLEPQLEDRLFTVHPDEGVGQTKSIISMTASQRSGTFKGLDKKKIDIWKRYHELLQPVEVVIPFADRIAEHINKNETVPLSTRRAFKRVLIVIQSVACAYQYQRRKDAQGKIIAEIPDYWMALQIVKESFRENMGAPDEKTVERLNYVREHGPVKSKDLAKKYGVSASSISAWAAKNVKSGTLTWCDEYGNTFMDEKSLDKAKRSGKAYLKIEDDTSITVTGLPSPAELTNGTDWNENGRLRKIYHLGLAKEPINREVFNGVYGVFGGDINTTRDDQAVNNIEESDDFKTGVRVFDENTGVTAKNINDDDDSVRSWAVGLSEIINGDKGYETNATRTPHPCRNGCKHYDGVTDVNDGQFKEYCCVTGKIIDEGYSCQRFETKGVKLPEGILAI